MDLTAQARLVRTCAVFVFACTGSTAEPPAAVSTAEPTITTSSVECDTTAAEWSFDLRTDGWTGNGLVLLSTDGAYLEQHPIYTVGSEADGTADHLRLELGVVPDFRDVVFGSTTVFNCREADLTGLIRVWTRDGESQADCLAFGDAPERWAEWVVGCDTTLGDTG